MTKIISAFPACGKTYLFESGEYNCLDSDSSNFSWTTQFTGSENKKAEFKKVRDPDFPNNYIQHIKENIGKVDYIFVSLHIDVQRALDEANLRWVCVKPRMHLMLEWVGRCYLRGNNKRFIDTMVENWQDWTKDVWVSGLNPCATVRLGSGEHLSDHMHFIETVSGN